jgi:hypothetical protein
MITKSFRGDVLRQILPLLLRCPAVYSFGPEDFAAFVDDLDWSNCAGSADDRRQDQFQCRESEAVRINNLLLLVTNRLGLLADLSSTAS